LKYYVVIDCYGMNSPYWAGKQILLIYVNMNYQTLNELSVETIFQNYIRAPKHKAIALSHKVEEQGTALEYSSKITEDLENQKTQLEEINLVLKNEKIIIENEKAALENQKARLEIELDNSKQQNIELCFSIEKAEAELFEQIANLNRIKDIVLQARTFCFSLVGTRLFKMVHFVSRLKQQGMSKTKEERKKFTKWFFNRFRRASDCDRRFNPIFGIINILDNALTVNNIDENGSCISLKQNDEIRKSDTLHDDNKSKRRKSILNQPYKKYDVIMLAIIDYGFRYQRPQHFADRFAENGHRVFYVNANHYSEYSVKEEKKDLFIINLKNNDFSAIHLTDWSKNMEEIKQSFDKLLFDYCIRDAIVIVDYPNWIHGAEYLRNHYGFKIITDYMDDFTGFLNPAGNLVGKNCKKLLNTSDLVVASSQFLYDIASQYNKNVDVVRNGGEYDHFHKAFTPKKSNEKKTIGYYGAIAHWFDIEKVCYVAEHLPECKIVLIGEVTAGSEQFVKHPNIELIGELPYDRLPSYLVNFDVCLIPFDTKTDLIKATNPVKFYEYLSAGKKIVATEIPELFPFKDKYVYLANENEAFLKYIQLCLENTDTLATPEESAIFGKENDWQNRYEVFSQLCKNVVPKVSVIILTYNNLAFNRQCVQSVFKKTAYPNFEVIIVDNMSTDGTREYLQELDKKGIGNLKIILNDENKGFAGGNNVGISAAKGDYVLLLNNDTIVTRGWMTSLVKHIENNSVIGMCGPVTNAIGNEAKVKVRYKNIIGLNEFAYNYTWEHIGKEWKDPKVLAFFCILIKRDVIEKCGLLDTSYKVGMFEDDDYAEAVKRVGYNLTIAEDSFVHHFGGATFKKIQDKKYKEIFDSNKKSFEKKWNKKWVPHVYRPGVTWKTNKDLKLEEHSNC